MIPIILLNTKYEEANRTLQISSSALGGSQVLSGRQKIVTTEDDNELNSANQCQVPAGSPS